MVPLLVDNQSIFIAMPMRICYTLFMNNTLYITDLDGTLLTPRAELTGFAEENLKRLMGNGLLFTVATARTWQSASIVLKKILPLAAPAVLLNGALIYDTQANKYVQKAIIPEQALLELLRVARAHGQTGFIYSIRDGYIRPYHEDISDRPVLLDFMAARTGYYKFIRTPDLGLHANEEIVHFTMQDSYGALAPLRDAIEVLPEIACVLYEDAYLAGNWYLECYSHTATKGNAVRFLRERYGYEKIIGFGDNLNDIPLFEACDETYAVSNAKDELKAMATGVIGSNDGDGVVEFLVAPPCHSLHQQSGQPLHGASSPARGGSSFSKKEPGGLGCSERSNIKNLEIRRATIDDAPACAEIHCRGWEAAYADFIPAEAIAEKNAARPAAWPGYLTSGKFEYYVPVLDGKVVGFLSLRSPEEHENLPDHYYEVGGIYLHPDYYRRGIGRRLMASAEERAREKGKSAMMLWVFEDNDSSRRFYEACGYRPDGKTQTSEYGGKTLRSLRYVKENICSP